jgi:YVTN family beta-propeller protein
MRAALVAIFLASATVAPAWAQTASPTLDYQFFKTKVQPIFLAARQNHARCIACHGSGTTMRLRPPAAGGATWSEEDSRKNFEIVSLFAKSGVRSKLLTHPLAEEAGGDFYHSGGKQFTTQSDPEWQTLRAFVMGATTMPAHATSPQGKVRIIQTNAAGDNLHIIDPETNRVVGVIDGIEANHGVAVAPQGGRIYVSNESGQSLDIVDGKTLQVLKRAPLSGHPNNIAISKDGRRVYVGIIQEPGGVDVIDTASMQRVKTIPTRGTIHNPYVTPDGKYVVAGSIAGKTINVIDAQTEQPAWTLDMDLGIRPMTFSWNADGSTRWIFAQLTGFNGFAVIDFSTRKEIRRIQNPDLPSGKSTVPEGSDPSHGMAVTADGKTLVVCSRLNNYLYTYSLPDLTPIGGAELGGKGAGWVTLSQDGNTAYVANPVTNDVSVVDIVALKEIARIPVGFVPKRNTTGLLP